MRKALIFKGGWDGHTPNETSELFKTMLEAEGVEVDIIDDMTFFDEYEPLKQYDLIVPVRTMSEITMNQCRNIAQAVSEGMGMAGCHGGMCDAFRMNELWQFMTGGQWVAHPGNDTVTYTVNLVSGSEFTEGLQDFQITSEQYYMHVDPAVQVHATTTFPTVGGNHSPNGEVKMPVVFTKMWGKGRVFYLSIGHTYRDFEIPEAKELMRRGFLWAGNK